MVYDRPLVIGFPQFYTGEKQIPDFALERGDRVNAIAFAPNGSDFDRWDAHIVRMGCCA
jgi:hypothetical protein